MCGSEGVQTELVGDEGGDDEGGRVEVEVEGYPRVESLHRGGCRLAETEADGRAAAARLAERKTAEGGVTNIVQIFILT